MLARALLQMEMGKRPGYSLAMSSSDCRPEADWERQGPRRRGFTTWEAALDSHSSNWPRSETQSLRLLLALAHDDGRATTRQGANATLLTYKH